MDRRLWIAFVACTVATAAFAACLGWNLGGEDVVLYVSDLGTVLAALAASAMGVHAGSRQRGRLRVFWWLLAAACAAWMSGEAIWTVYDLGGLGEPPIPSWADVGYLTFIPLAVIGLLCHPALHGNARRQARSVLDGLAIAVALLFLSWTFVLGPLWWSSNLTTLGGLVTLAYPVSDVVLVFVVVLAVRRMTTAGRLELWCLLTGLVALAFADTTYAYVVTVHGYSTGNLLDTGWFAAFLAIALAALAADAGEVRVHADASLPALSSIVAPFVPVLVALAVAGASVHLGHRPDLVGLLMALFLMLLTLARQALLVIDFVAAGRRAGAGSLVDRLAAAVLGRAPADDESAVDESGPPPVERSPA